MVHQPLIVAVELFFFKDMYMVSKILRLPPMDNALDEPLPNEVPEARIFKVQLFQKVTSGRLRPFMRLSPGISQVLRAELMRMFLSFCFEMRKSFQNNNMSISISQNNNISFSIVFQYLISISQ